MYYVYLIRSLKFPKKIYIGHTNDLKRRIDVHNSGGSIYTEPYRPWTVVMYSAFASESKAIEFEQYLKSGSGAAFAKKHLW